MSWTAIQICNIALAKQGGAGDQVAATGQITSLAATDPISVWCNTLYQMSVQRVIIDMALMKAPIRSTVKLVELDDELCDADVVISNISVDGAFLVTVTTDEVHGKTTGDTVVLKGIDGTGGIGAALNGVTKTIVVTSTTAFTLNSTTGSASWVYTEDSGIVSRAPEMGPYTYAFDLPSGYIAVVRVTDEVFTSDEDTRKEYRSEIIRNKDNSGDLILTNELTNYDGDGIYLEYAFDPTASILESAATPFGTHVVDAIATFLSSELAPVTGRNTDVALAMLAKYINQALPSAIAFNQSQGNTTATARKDFRGGRNATLPTGF